MGQKKRIEQVSLVRTEHTKKRAFSYCTWWKMTYNFHFSHQQTSLHKAWMLTVKSWHYYCPTPADKALKQPQGERHTTCI